MSFVLLAQTEFEDFQQFEQPGAGIGVVGLVIYLAFIVFMIAALWGVFGKAGYPGWAAIVPVYNALVLLWVARRPWWWLILFMIPLVNIVIAILVAVDVAQNFGKRAGFGIGLFFLPFIFYPILAWGSATYQRAPGAEAA